MRAGEPMKPPRWAVDTLRDALGRRNSINNARAMNAARI
jgi:hypothetical protein